MLHPKKDPLPVNRGERFNLLVENLTGYFKRASEKEQQAALDFLEDFTHSNGRKYFRKDCTLPVHYAVGSKKVTSTVGNISAGGVFVEKAAEIGAKQRVALNIQLPGSVIPSEINGRVAWKSSEGFGVQFVANAYMEKQLERFLERF